MQSLLAAVALVAGTALSQRVPYRERPEAYERDNGRNSDRGDRNQAGAFDYYVLALSWSPTYCADRRGNGYEPQCDVRSGRPYAFVLHGLWPQHERGWPQDCRSSDRGWVPGPVAERMLDIMPSKRLVFHEYRKHGTCSGLGVDGYFDLARQPARQGARSRSDSCASPTTACLSARASSVDDFLAANPELKPDMIAVQCGGSGNRLREVRICFDKGGEFPRLRPQREPAPAVLGRPHVRAAGSRQCGPARAEPDRPSGPPREIVPCPK